MSIQNIPIDEFTYRGIDPITEPDELCYIFEKIVQALPDSKNVTKDRCWEEFSIAWDVERGT